MANNLNIGGVVHGTSEVGGTHYPIHKTGYGPDGAIVVMDTKPAADVTVTAAVTELQTLNSKIAKGAATEADSIAVADSSLTIVTGVSGAHIQNIDMITNVVNGWFDVGDFTSTTVQLITSPGISGGVVTFEQTNDTTLAAAGSAILGYDVAVASPTAPLFTINLIASTVRVIRFPLHCKYFRVRTSTAVLGGTAQVSMALSQRPLAHTANHVYSSYAANFSAMVSGNAGHASAATGNPVSVAGVVKTAVATAGTNGNVSRLSVSASGANVTMPYSIPELDWQSSVVITTATDVTLKTAGGATVRNYCTNIDYINTSAVATTIIIKDGTTAIWTGYAPANMTLPASIAFIRPKKTAVNTALNVAAGTTGANVYFNAGGYSDV